MKELLKKNQAIIAVITLMLIAAGYLNYNSSINALSTSSILAESENVASIGDARLVNANLLEESKDDDTALTSSENDYFSGSRIERDTMYSQIIESYQKIIENDNASKEQKDVAQNEIIKINEQKNALMIAENLIKTKGFEDLIIFVNNDNVNIVVKADELETEQIAQIQNIIERELKIGIENIHISNKV